MRRELMTIFLAAVLWSLPVMPPAAAQDRPVMMSVILWGQAVVETGDRLLVDNVPVRLYGIAAPRPGTRCQVQDGPAIDCAELAAEVLRGLLANHMPIQCDTRNRGQGLDADGRLLVVCFGQRESDLVADGRHAIDLAAAMVLAGMARRLPAYDAQDYGLAEDRAKRDRMGFWDCERETPPQWQGDKRPLCLGR